MFVGRPWHREEANTQKVLWDQDGWQLNVLAKTAVVCAQSEFRFSTTQQLSRIGPNSSAWHVIDDLFCVFDDLFDD